MYGFFLCLDGLIFTEPFLECNFVFETTSKWKQQHAEKHLHLGVKSKGYLENSLCRLNLLCNFQLFEKDLKISN